MLAYFNFSKKPVTQAKLESHIYFAGRIKALEAYMVVARDVLRPEAALHNNKLLAVQAKLNLYHLMLLTNLPDVSVEVHSLILAYEDLVEKLYNAEEAASYYLLHKLQKLLVIETNITQRCKLAAAINICEIKLLLLGIDIKLLQIQVTNALAIDWLLPIVQCELGMTKNKYAHYDNLNFSYVHEQSKVSFINPPIVDDFKITSEFLENILILQDPPDGDLIDLLALVLIRDAIPEQLYCAEQQIAVNARLLL